MRRGSAGEDGILEVAREEGRAKALDRGNSDAAGRAAGVTGEPRVTAMGIHRILVFMSCVLSMAALSSMEHELWKRIDPRVRWHIG